MSLRQNSGIFWPPGIQGRIFMCWIEHGGLEEQVIKTEDILLWYFDREREETQSIERDGLRFFCQEIG